MSLILAIFSPSGRVLLNISIIKSVWLKLIINLCDRFGDRCEDYEWDTRTLSMFTFIAFTVLSIAKVNGHEVGNLVLIAYVLISVISILLAHIFKRAHETYIFSDPNRRVQWVSECIFLCLIVERKLDGSNGDRVME